MAAGRLPQKVPLELMQTTWATELNPIIANPLVQGLLIKEMPLKANEPCTFSHKLGRKQQGWVIIDQNAKASIYRSTPLNNLTLTLVSDADVTVSVWVF